MAKNKEKVFNKTYKVIFILRLAMGWVFLYAGISKLANSEWSAVGYLSGAKTFSAMYSWFILPQNLPWVNFLNEWGLTLVGAALIFGVFTRFASYCGIALMALYYFPAMHFPYVGNNAFLIDEHIIYILVLCLLIAADSGKHYGLDKYNFKKLWRK